MANVYNYISTFDFINQVDITSVTFHYHSGKTHLHPVKSVISLLSKSTSFTVRHKKNSSLIGDKKKL